MTNEIGIKRLAKTLKGMKPERLRMLLAKDKGITIRLSESDRDDMRRVAKSLNLTVTGYITRMHYLVSESLERK